jgi:uncharacterized membrane protein
MGRVYKAMNYSAFIILVIILIVIMIYMGLLNFKIVKNIDHASSSSEKAYKYKIRIKIFMIEYENTIYYTSNSKAKND